MQTVCARAPGRVSLAGGGTDLPAYYERHGGAVVSLTVDLAASAQVSPLGSGLELASLDDGSRESIPADRVEQRLRYPFLAEEFLTVQKAVAWHFGLDRARIATSSRLPPGGGLGASAAVCVAVVAASAAYLGETLDRTRVAEIASRIEMTVMRRPCGKQDQYAAAHGGLNLIEFGRDGAVRVAPVATTPEIRRDIADHLLLFSNGARRNAAGPLAELSMRIVDEDAQTLAALSELRRVAYEIRTALERGDIESVGALVDRGWKAKRRLHPRASGPEVDRIISLAVREGAYGGKLSGAGMAGEVLVVCPPARRDDIRGVLATQGWRWRPIEPDDDGVVVERTADGAVSI